MDNSQVVELVIVERQNGNGLFVLDWEYDRITNKVLCLRLFDFEDWKTGRRDHPAYIAPKGEPVLFERDPSGYISTSKRLRSLEENGKWYDEYGRCYARCAVEIHLSELKCRLLPTTLLEKLNGEEIKKLVSIESSPLVNGSGNFKVSQELSAPKEETGEAAP
jgi:hypothetical protein